MRDATDRWQMGLSWSVRKNGNMIDVYLSALRFKHDNAFVGAVAEVAVVERCDA
jgi:hypothetical protein